MTYDASLEHLASRIRAGDWQALDSLLALCSAQGEQVTRLLNASVQCAQHEARIAELEDIIRRQNEKRMGKKPAA